MGRLKNSATRFDASGANPFVLEQIERVGVAQGHAFGLEQRVFDHVVRVPGVVQNVLAKRSQLCLECLVGKAEVRKVDGLRLATRE